MSTETLDLMNPKQLADEFKLSNVTVQTWLDEAELAPVATLPYGRGTMRLYKPEAARRVITARLQPAGAPPSNPDKVLLDALENQIEETKHLRDTVETLKRQNKALFQLVNETLTPKIDRLLAVWEAKP